MTDGKPGLLSRLLSMSRREVEEISHERGLSFRARDSKRKIAEAIEQQEFSDRRRANYLPRTKDIF